MRSRRRTHHSHVAWSGSDEEFQSQTPQPAWDAAWDRVRAERKQAGLPSAYKRVWNSGLKLVDPEDPQDVAEAIGFALSDNDLVDRAALQNADVARERLQYAMIRARAITYYESVMRGDGSSR